MDNTYTMTATKSKQNVIVTIRVGDKEVKQVNSAVYLVSAIHGEGLSEKEIVKRIGIAKKPFGSMVQILKNLGMSMKVRIRILKYFVSSRFLYGCET